MLLAALVLVVVWPLRGRLRVPTATVWLVLGLLAAGRFFEFFLRSDSASGPLGLSIAQWTSVAIFTVAVAAAGRLVVSAQPNGTATAGPAHEDEGRRGFRLDRPERRGWKGA